MRKIMPYRMHTFFWKGSVIGAFLWAGCSTTTPVNYQEQYSPDVALPSVETPAGGNQDTAISKSKREESDTQRSSAKSAKGKSAQPSEDQEVGTASWYGPGFHGKKTASGEKFNQNELTAAHPTLPLGSKAEVKNLKTGKSIEVEITDRGPSVKGRDIDLSRAAAQKVGLTKKKGLAPVAIEPTEK